MNLQNRVITLILLLYIFVGCSQNQPLKWIPFYWEGDTISGKYIERAFMYIPVKIEELPYDFTMQLDLGACKSVLYGNAIGPHLKSCTSLMSKLDLNRSMFSKIKLQMGTVEFNGLDVDYYKNFGETISKDSLYTKSLKDIGVIASDIFQDKILIIDYKLNKLAVSDYLPTEYENLPARKFELIDGLVKLPFYINGQACKLIFDTGSSPFQLVTSKERALEISDSVVIDSLSGPLWWGKEITFYGFKVNRPIELGGKVFENSRVYYDKEGLWNDIYNSMDVWGITGNAYFFDNIVIIDYKNKLFQIK